MNTLLKSACAVATLVLAAQASAEVTFYERENFSGRSFVADRESPNFERVGFNDRASSVIVDGGPWELCEDAGFRGRCVVLRPGRYASLNAVGLNDRISSARRADMAGRPVPAPPVAEAITFYDQERFAGRTFSTEQPVGNLERAGFNDRASSAVVSGGASWEVCSDARFSGRCAVLRPGEYPSLATMNLNDRISSVRKVDGPPPPPVALRPAATFYEQEAFRGRSFTTEQAVGNLDRYGFNGRAASADVIGGSWQVCEDPRFGGRCMQLQPGRYPDLRSMGLGDRVASAQLIPVGGPVAVIDPPRPPAPPQPVYDARRRGDERLYQANVTSVREVLGTPEQRCWVEREPVAQSNNPANVPGALAGAVLGGILGHQVGGGSGKDLATVGGAFAGAVVGANVNRNAPSTQEVQRCSSNQTQARPNYWEVTYNFRGLEHRVQMASPPPATLTVNDQGEPRI